MGLFTGRKFGGFVCLFVLFCSAVDGTQGLMYTRQLVYRRASPTAPQWDYSREALFFFFRVNMH